MIAVNKRLVLRENKGYPVNVFIQVIWPWATWFYPYKQGRSKLRLNIPVSSVFLFF